MRILYSLLIYLHQFLALVFSGFSPKARDWVNGRKDILRKMRLAKGDSTQCIWVHCASLGEFEQGRPVIEEVRKEFPDYKILLTFFSPSGYNVRKNYPGTDWVFYLPADTPSNARHFLNIWNPKVAVFVKYEFWFNYLHALQIRNIPTLLISAHFRVQQDFFKPWGFWFRKHLKGFNRFFVQNPESLRLLQSIGIDRVTVSGDTRFDRVVAISKQPVAVANFIRFPDNAPVLIAGSTWPPDEEMLLSLINDQKVNLRFVIVPHEIQHAHIKAYAAQVQGGAQILSEIVPGTLFYERVLIVDSVGLLSGLYQYGTLAYIGGGFGRGIHNILEAATFGLPVIFGPNYKQFAEAADLTLSGGAFSIRNTQELLSTIVGLLDNPAALANAGSICSDYVQSKTGATKAIIQEMKLLLDKK